MVNKKKEEMKFPKYAQIRISNIVANGRFNFKKIISCEETQKIIDESCFGWNIVNQETTPQLSTYIFREDQSKVYLQLWHTGKFYMTGIKSEDEVKTYFKIILKELKSLVPEVFNGGGNETGKRN